MSVIAHDFIKAFSTNSTTDAFGSIIPTATVPTSTSSLAVIDLLSDSLGWGSASNVPEHLQYMPYGTDANNETFGMRVWGYSKVARESLYIPQLLLNLAVTLGNISAAAVGTNHFMADTITVTDGPADNSEWRSFIDDQADLGSSIIAHTRGVRWIAIEVNVGPTTETAASANCFVRAL